MHKVERKYSFDPNFTAEDEKREKEIPVGTMFVCLQYTVTNKGTKDELWPGLSLIDAKGGEHVTDWPEGAKVPADWANELTDGEHLAAGKAGKGFACYTMRKETDGKLKVRAELEGFKEKAWELVMDI